MLRFNEDNQVIKKEKYNAILVGIQRDEDISYSMEAVSYTHLRAHETGRNLVCRLLLEKKKKHEKKKKKRV